MSFVVGQPVRCEVSNWHINGTEVCGPERGRIYVVVGVHQIEKWEVLEFTDFKNTYTSDCFCSLEQANQLDAMANLALYPKPPGLSLDIFHDFELRSDLIDEVDLIENSRQ
jgi:hypothetical protein